MLKEYLSNIADQFRTHLDTTEPINAQDFADKIGEVYDKGLLEGLAQAKAEGRKTEYVQEYFTGSKQYLTYSIDFEPKLIFFESNDSNNTVMANKPDIDVATLNMPKSIVYCAHDFTEAQEYSLGGVFVWRYKKAEDTLSYASSTSKYIDYSYNSTTEKWDITFGREDSSTTATRFVSSGQSPVQALFIGKAEPSVLEGTITITENTKELKIEGLPKAPKTFNLVAQDASQPTTDDVRLVRGLDYMADGISSGTVKLLANLWLLVSTNVYNSGFVMGQILSSHNDKENLITFENGIFTLKMRDTGGIYYGANFTYKWIATF